MRSSDRGFTRFFVLLALWALGAACARGPGSEYEPRPQRMVPAWGLNSAPVPVVIEGENFLALVTQHIGGPEPVSEDARFEAFLDEVALEDVTLEDAHTLRARVPEGLAPGWHTLTVKGPLGQQVELPRAYLSSDRLLALLGARAALERRRVWVGDRTRLSLTVENTGGTFALGVTPVLSLEGEGRVEVLSEPEPANIGPGTSASFIWELSAVSSGDLRFTVEARGREETTGMELPVPAVEAGPLELRNHPALTAVLTSSSQVVNVGQQFELTLEVKNTGDAAVLDVRPMGIVSGCDGRVSLVSGPDPAAADIPARGRVTFRARLVGTGEGSCVFRVGARGKEETEGTLVETPTLEAPVKVQRPAALTVTFSAPTRARPGSTFAVALTVKNTGSTPALGVQPKRLTVSRNIVEPASEPTLTPVELAGGASTTYTWSYRVTRPGKVSFSSSASGTDGVAGSPVGSGNASSSEVSILEVESARADPFKDGSSFAQVFPYRGRLVLGPNRNGTKAVSVDPDEAEEGDLTFTFSFSKDTRGNTSENTSQPPYSSIGATGCTPNTASCGPDNEDGRGFFFAGQEGAREWLGLGGARSKSLLSYVYLTQDASGPLGMRFMDLSALLGGQTRGFSSALFFHDRLYLGFPDTGGKRPYLLAVRSFPTSAPGLDVVSGTHAENLEADAMPGIGLNGTPANKASVQMIDTLAAFNDRLYVVNNGGCIRSTTPTPRSYDSAPGDWSSCTPTTWSARTSKTTTKTADLEPSDKAIPRLAVFQGRLYLGRNTTVGPQLFACDPAKTGSATDCDPADWALVAANSTGDSLLTQFDNPANTALSLLVATSRSLFVGFDNGTQGAVVLRTSNPRPAQRSDFTGSDECSATQHPTGCAGLGGSGLGEGATRIFDGVAFGPAGNETAYLTAGTGTGPVRLFRLLE